MSEHEYSPMVARLRQLARTAARSGEVMSTEPHPDAALLELCATILDLRAEHDAVDREARKMPNPHMGNPAFEVEMEKRDRLRDAWRTPLARVGKFKSKTACGVYAKAHILRMSRGHSPVLALSIADDLATCPGLRALLWPAAEEA